MVWNGLRACVGIGFGQSAQPQAFGEIQGAVLRPLRFKVGTMERTVKEGQVATANTYAQMFSNLPSCGRPTRLLIYDLHTLQVPRRSPSSRSSGGFVCTLLGHCDRLGVLAVVMVVVMVVGGVQNRFYLHGNVIGSLKTSVPLLLAELQKNGIDCVAFPDDGSRRHRPLPRRRRPRCRHPPPPTRPPRRTRRLASLPPCLRAGAAKRFGSMFAGLGLEVVTCGKQRDGDKRTVSIQVPRVTVWCHGLGFGVWF